MKKELRSMKHNDILNLVKQSQVWKKVDCKWVFKTKVTLMANLRNQTCW